MKKLLAAALALLLIFSGFACQPTPETDVVKQKNIAQMISSASNGNKAVDPNASLAEQYGIPDTYTFSARGKTNTKFGVKVNAVIVLPAVNQLPIARVVAADFTQAQVDALWSELVGDTEMWQDGGTQTGSDIAQYIAYLQELLNDPEELESQTLMLVPEAEAEIERLKEEFRNAPQSNEELRCYGKLETMPFYGTRQADYKTTLPLTTRLSAREKGYGKMIQIENRSGAKKNIEVYDNDGNLAFTMTPMSNAMFSFSYDARHGGAAIGYNTLGAFTPVTAQTVLDEATQKAVGLSPAEAFDTMTAFLDRACPGMAIDRAYLAKRQNVYHFECARMVAGVLVAHNAMGSGGMWEPYWGYERLDVELTKDGLCHFMWLAPMTVLETINADARLLPFSEICRIFESMVFAKYELSDTLPDHVFEIDRVELSLQRISEQDSFESGLLIPVWNFYEKGRLFYSSDGTESVLTINAVDGSIIDAAKGY